MPENNRTLSFDLTDCDACKAYALLVRNCNEAGLPFKIWNIGNEGIIRIGEGY